MSNAKENETLRLETFSDGVFAIATTLLAFQLEAPKHPEGEFRSGLLLHALAKQWPAYIAFFLSFATLYILWVNHHRLYNVIHRSDARFMFYNGLHLLLISMIPFTTSLLSNFINTDAMALAALVYMFLFACICGTLLLMWIHASTDFYLLKRPAADVKVKTVRLGLIISASAYGVAALLALLVPYVSLVIGLAIVIYLARLKYHRERVV
ncbi:hypothetical protein FAES_1320 [Fibrella aestuarina BUZ 2]|uniref:DUF1211 domain-containing protein n=1 Tax=Fibrella aestuarina BUZ 2 TaxID=1166018 RepID=I0K5C7_9BACT|nr:TMEM175 family protein [Fibrella aestuarina]CCG99330.1 hypothetical protein FAES_1320 [Fibrella aestuarina BUZ 2]